MQKKLIAVAVAGALGAPSLAFAQASTVQIYGAVNVEYAYIDEGGTRNKYDRLTNPGGSSIGFRGEEKLGGGLSAWFQCESTFEAPGAGATLCRRNSAVGLKGGFGNIFLGNWFTATRLSAIDATGWRPWPTTSIYGVASLLYNESTTAANGTVTTITTNVVVAATGATVVVGTTIATTASAGNATSFARRQNNQIQYWTPTWNGFTGRFSWSAKNETAGTVAGAAEPRVISFGVDYKTGPFAIGVGYQRHEEFRAVAGAPAGTFGDDTGWLVSAAYTFGPVKIGAAYDRLEYETGAAGNPGAETRRNAWAISADWRIQGPHGLKAAFIKADDSKGGGGAVNSIGSSIPGATVTPQGSAVAIPAGDNGAEHFSIQYVYTFSKRTSVGFGYTQIDNDSAGLYKIRDGAVRATGRDQDAFGISVYHRF